MTKKFSIKKLVAGVLAAAMVVTALPVSGLSVKAAGSDTEKVYRSYNPNDGEHLYTRDAAEHNFLVAQGRSDEGVKFVVPKTSNTPIYRVYNPNSGEHLLVPKGEAEGLSKIGWKNEDVKMYSDDNKGVGIYRVYNPNATDAGAHLYTASKDEATYLVSLGWKWDNNGEPMFYGVDTEARNDLALEEVEGAAIDQNSGTYNVIIGYFNRPVGDLNAGDIQIRRVSDNQLFSVEKVSMSSDKKTATLTLANSSSAGASVVGLTPLVDYEMIVTSSEGSASKVFSIPGVYDEVTVSEVDPVNKTITLAQSHSWGAGAAVARVTNMDTLTVTDDIKIDYNEVLGRTVTVHFDKNKNLSKLVLINENVVYGAFKVTDKDGEAGATHLQDVVTKKVYELEGIKDTGSIYETVYQINAAPVNTEGAAALGAGATYEYGKAVLNANGTVRYFKGLTAVTNYGLIDKVDGDVAYCGTSAVNLKDYNIIKDGKTATIADTKDHLVLAFAATKEAVIYDNKVEGKISAVYADSFKIGDKSFKYTNNNAAASYVDGGKKNLTTDILNSYKSSGKDVTVYTDLSGAPRIVVGTTGAAQTEDITLVLTRQPDISSDGFDKVLAVEGYNPKSDKIERYTTLVSDITNLNKVSATGAPSNQLKPGDGKTIDGATAKAEITVDATTWADNDDLSSADAATYSAGSLLVVTRETESKKITGLTLADSAALGNLDGVAANNTTNKFKAGKSSINDSPVATDALVVTLSRTQTAAADPTVDKTMTFTGAESSLYSKYDGTVSIGARANDDATCATSDTRVYTNTDGKISAIVFLKDVDKTNSGVADRTDQTCNDAAFEGAVTTGDPIPAVVVDFKAGSGTGSNKTADELTVITPAGKVVYSKYASTYVAPVFTNAAKGSVVIITPVKDDPTTVAGVTVVASAENGKVAPADADPTGSKKIVLGTGTNVWMTDGVDANNDGTTDLKLLETNMVVRMTADGAELITWADVNGNTTNDVYLHQANNTTNFIDLVILTND